MLPAASDRDPRLPRAIREPLPPTARLLNPEVLNVVPTDRSDLWIRRYQPAPQAPTRLICFPHAGGSASYYHPVARMLGQDCDVLALQYPGRQDRYREAPLESVRELVAAVRQALDPWLDRPYAFFGHSMGAVLAYETARLLEGGTSPGPCRLFVSGRRAPSRTRTESVHLLSDSALAAHVKDLSGTDPSLLRDEELMRLFLPALRADYKAVETYRGGPDGQVRCPVTVFSGDRDPMTTREEAEAWRKHTSAASEVLRYPGGHFFLNEHATNVVAEIRKRDWSACGDHGRCPADTVRDASTSNL